MLTTMGMHRRYSGRLADLASTFRRPVAATGGMMLLAAFGLFVTVVPATASFAAAVVAAFGWCAWLEQQLD